MNCPRCNAVITNENASFCPQCGCNLSSGQETESGAQITAAKMNMPAPAAGVGMTKVNKTAIIVVAAIAVIIAAFFVIRYFIAPTPDKVMTKFLNNLKAGKYEEAYKCFDESRLTGSNYLTAEYFKKSFGDNPVTGYSYTVESSSDSKSSRTDNEKTVFNVILQYKKGSVAMNIPVYKRTSQGNKSKIVIDPSKFIKVTTIGQFDNALIVSLDNKKIETSKSNKIPMFLNTKLKIKITNNAIKPVEQEISAGDDFNYDESFEPSDDLASKAKETIDNYNKAWIKAVNSKSTYGLEQYVQQGSDEWNSAVDQLSYYKDITIKESDYLGIKFGKTSFYNNEFDNISIEVDETWIDQNNPNGHVINWIYYLKVADDGKLYITNCSHRY